MCFIYKLKLKTEKVGLEYIIWKKMQTEDASWIPAEGDYQKGIGKNIEPLEAAIEEQKIDIFAMHMIILPCKPFRAFAFIFCS